MPTLKNSDFNEPEYPEFDPTPYGGGYDIVSTYGKPLPPSDKICHPRSNPTQIQASHGEDLVDHKTIKQNGHPHSPPAVDNARNLDTPIVLPHSPLVGDNARDLDTPIVPGSREKPPTPAPAPAPIPTSTPESEYDYSPNGYSYPSEEKGYYDCGRQIPLPPNEYVEPCASLFGYWPCLLKEYQRDCMHRRCCEQDYASEWKKTEDYFFGNPYNYAETRDNGVGQVEYNYGYERHYPEQASYVVEKAVAQVDDNYGYESHYAEQPNDVGDKSLALVDYDYGYERDAEKSLALVDYDYGYEKNAEKSLALVDYDYVYEGDAEKSLALVDYNYGYERDYIGVGQPSYAFEQSIVQVGAYEKHYAEQTSHVYEQPISQVDSNYGYGREYTEHLSYVVEQPVAQVDYNYAYDTHYVEQPTAQVDYNYGYESNYVEQPSYDNAQPITQEDYSYGYGRQYAEQSNHVVEEPSYFEEEHSQQLWSQKLNYSYYESYQEP